MNIKQKKNVLIVISLGMILSACSPSNDFKLGTYVGGNGKSKASLTFLEAGACYASWGAVKLEMSCTYSTEQIENKILLVTIEKVPEKFAIGKNILTDGRGEILRRRE